MNEHNHYQFEPGFLELSEVMEKLQDQQVAKARLLGQLVGENIVLREKNSDLIEALMLDTATGLPSRYAFEKQLESLLPEATSQITEDKHLEEGAPNRRQSVGLTVFFCDLGEFKKINDTQGHRAGDTALASVGEALQRGLHREGDMVARYGGDEFAIITDTVGEDELPAMKARLVKAVSKQTAAEVGHPVVIHMGYATLTAGLIEESKELDVPLADLLVERADQAMYKDKYK